MEPVPGFGAEQAGLQITQESASTRKRKKVSMKRNTNCTNDSSSHVPVLLSKRAFSGKKVASANKSWHLPKPFQLHMSFLPHCCGVCCSQPFICLTSN